MTMTVQHYPVSWCPAHDEDCGLHPGCYDEIQRCACGQPWTEYAWCPGAYEELYDDGCARWIGHSGCEVDPYG